MNAQATQMIVIPTPHVQTQWVHSLVLAILDALGTVVVVRTSMSAHQTPPPITVLSMRLVQTLMVHSPVLVMKDIPEMEQRA